MSVRRIAVVYGARYGQTTRIAERITQVLTEAGHELNRKFAASLPETAAVGGTQSSLR